MPTIYYLYKEGQGGSEIYFCIASSKKEAKQKFKIGLVQIWEGISSVSEMDVEERADIREEIKECLENIQKIDGEVFGIDADKLEFGSDKLSMEHP